MWRKEERLHDSEGKLYLEKKDILKLLVNESEVKVGKQ